MNRGRFKRDLIIGFVILLAASVSINNVVAVNTGELIGDKLTLSYSNFSNGTSYKLIFPTSNSTISYEANSTENGKLEFILLDKLDSLKFQENFTVKVIEINGNQTTEINVINKAGSKITAQPSSTPSQTATVTPTPATTANASANVSEPPGKGILGIDPIYFIIIGLFILAISAVLYLSKLKQEKDPEQRLVSPSIATLVNQLQIDLFDESGFVRITDAKVRAIDKRGMPYHASVSSDGTYLLELPKGTCKIEVDGGGNYESTSREVKIPYKEERIKMSLIKRQPLQIEIVDESDNHIKGIGVRVKEAISGVDAKGTPETDSYGIAKFTLSKNKQYVVSVNTLTGGYINPGNIPLSSSETTKRIQLFKKAGELEITVTEQATGKPFAGMPVSVMKKGASQAMDFATDNNGRINQKLSIGDYIIRLKPSNPPLYDSIEKQVTIIENGTCSVTLDFRFNYQPKPEFLNSISKINEKLNTGFKEVSTYDTCIPLFFKKVGEKPTQLVDKIIKRPGEFMGAKTSPDEIIKYTLSTTEVLADEISRIMREKSNVDFYFSIRNLAPVDDLTISDYPQEKFNELVHDTANYHKNHFREVGNKLNEIDNELTQLSGTLTIQPVADLWRVAQKLLESSINEADAKKRGVMLFINDKLLDHVREMYTKEEVKARLKISMF